MDHPRICLGILKSKQKIPLSNYLELNIKIMILEKVLVFQKFIKERKEFFQLMLFRSQIQNMMMK